MHILVILWKIITLFLVIWFVKEIPSTMHQEVRPRRAYIYYAAIYLIFLSSVVSILYHFNDGIVWYRTPLIFIGALLGVTWVEMSQRTNVSKVQQKPKGR